MVKTLLSLWLLVSNYIVAAAAIRFEQRANFLTVHVGPAGLAGFSSALIYSACVSAAVVTDKTYNNSNNNSNKQHQICQLFAD